MNWNTVGEIVSVVVGFSGLGGLFVTYLHSHEANDIRRFEVTLKGFESRISDLEHELGIVKQALITEQSEHARTRKVRDIALRFIREVLARHGDGDPIPEPSPELQAEL